MQETDTSPILILLHTVGREGGREAGPPSSPSHFLSLSNQTPPPLTLRSQQRHKPSTTISPTNQPTTSPKKTQAIQVHYHPPPLSPSPAHLPKTASIPTASLPPPWPPLPHHPHSKPSSMHVEPQKQNAEKKKNSRPHHDLIVILQKSQFSQNTTIHTYINHAENSLKRSRALVQKKLLFQKSSSRWGGIFLSALLYVCMYVLWGGKVCRFTPNWYSVRVGT